MQERHAVRRTGVLAVAVAMLAAFIAVVIPATARAATVIGNYRVILENLTPGQPFSPPVAATHATSTHLFEVGSMASDELAALAQGGDQSALVALLAGLADVTDVHDVGMPLTPAGSTSGGFSDTVEFDIIGDSSDVFSLAGMLICTNDGIAGVDSVALPTSGSVTYDVGDYDAGREDNTEVSEDLVDPCSGLGPVGLDGDPDGNDDVGPATTPAGVVTAHPNIAGLGELDAAAHGWTGPVASLTISVLENAFVDDEGNVHEGDINASAAAGITKGSNPPDNTEFSPGEVLTRGQAAAFFRRALGLPASSTDFLHGRRQFHLRGGHQCNRSCRDHQGVGPSREHDVQPERVGHEGAARVDVDQGAGGGLRAKKYGNRHIAMLRMVAQSQD